MLGDYVVISVGVVVIVEEFILPLLHEFAVTARSARRVRPIDDGTNLGLVWYFLRDVVSLLRLSIPVHIFLIVVRNLQLHVRPSLVFEASKLLKLVELVVLVVIFILDTFSHANRYNCINLVLLHGSHLSSAMAQALLAMNFALAGDTLLI